MSTQSPVFSTLATVCRARRQFQDRASDEVGASSVEYGLLAVAIAAVIVIIVFALGGVVTELFADTCTTLTSTASAVSASCG